MSGKGGAFAATPPLQLTVRLGNDFPCGNSTFAIGKQTCVLKNDGKSLSCK